MNKGVAQKWISVNFATAGRSLNTILNVFALSDVHMEFLAPNVERIVLITMMRMIKGYIKLKNSRYPTTKEKDKIPAHTRLIPDHHNKLLSGQPFEVFSSSSLTNNTSNCSRKMSDTSSESKLTHQTVEKRKKEASPKKNRTTPSTPESNFIFIQSHDDDDTPKVVPIDYTSMFSE